MWQEAADLDLVDQVVGPFERLPSVRTRCDGMRGAEPLDDPFRGAVGISEPLGVDIVQRDREAAPELGVGAEVGQDVPGELDAPGADDRHLGHVRV